MTKKQDRGLDAQASHLNQQETATSLASDRCGGSRAGGGQEAAESLASGAPPSNTAPDNCNVPYFQPLRWGVDSLYLSYPGMLSLESDSLLRGLKELAQSTNPEQQAKAQIEIDGHLFMVKERGASLFPYILENKAFRIQLARRNSTAPMAYVKVSAIYLAHLGPQEAERRLYSLLAHLGEIKDSANVSRIDLYVDFVSSVDMEGWDRHAWVTRASAINTYAVSGRFSGWSIGLGGVMSARLYNKRLELAHSGKDWLLSLWQKAGWIDGHPVWRLEFEIKREVLAEKDVAKLYRALEHLGGLWSYATTEWLRLTLPSADDKTRSRWPIHPLWGMLSSVDWESRGGSLLKRLHPGASPRDNKLFQTVYSAFLTFMAKRGMEIKSEDDLIEGIARCLAAAYDYHIEDARLQGLRLAELMAQKLAIKHRVYGTRLNDPELGAKLRAKAYRKASGG